MGRISVFPFDNQVVIIVGQPVTFKFKGDQIPTEWNFHDATPALPSSISVDNEVTHTFTKAGIYNVVVQVNGQLYQQKVTVIDPIVKPTLPAKPSATPSTVAGTAAKISNS